MAEIDNIYQLYAWLSMLIEEAEEKGHDHLGLTMSVDVAKKLAKVMAEGLFC